MHHASKLSAENVACTGIEDDKKDLPLHEPETGSLAAL